MECRAKWHPSFPSPALEKQKTLPATEVASDLLLRMEVHGPCHEGLASTKDWAHGR